MASSAEIHAIVKYMARIGWGPNTRARGGKEATNWDMDSGSWHP